MSLTGTGEFLLPRSFRFFGRHSGVQLIVPKFPLLP